MDLITKLVDEYRDTGVADAAAMIAVENFQAFATAWLRHNPVQGIGRGAAGETLLIAGESFDIQPMRHSGGLPGDTIAVTHSAPSAVRSHPQDNGDVPITRGDYG
jgi:hypothetical protein